MFETILDIRCIIIIIITIYSLTTKKKIFLNFNKLF
jgi:hypothetical protein